MGQLSMRSLALLACFVCAVSVQGFAPSPYLAPSVGRICRGRGSLALRMSDVSSSPLDRVRRIFQATASGLQAQAQAAAVKAADSSSAAEMSGNLKRLLLQGLEMREFERQEIDELISALSATGSRVDPALVSSGPWQAVYTKNSTPLWEKQSKYIPFVKNRAWQDYDLRIGRVVNVGQILGDKVFVSVEGAVSEQSTSDRTPKFYTADIDQGALNVLGLRIPLPIKGRGVAKLLYHDANLRIFESPKESESEWEQEGLVVVQMPLWKKF